MGLSRKRACFLTCCISSTRAWRTKTGSSQPPLRHRNARRPESSSAPLRSARLHFADSAFSTPENEIDRACHHSIPQIDRFGAAHDTRLLAQTLTYVRVNIYRKQDRGLMHITARFENRRR